MFGTRTTNQFRYVPDTSVALSEGLVGPAQLRAWGMLWELSGERAHWLAASERSRLRTNIRKLNAEDVVLRVRRRATLHQYRILPTYVDRIATDSACISMMTSSFCSAVAPTCPTPSSPAI